MIGLLAVTPVREIGLVCRGILNHDVIDSVLQSRSPAQDALHTCRIGSDDADSRERHSGGCHVLEHAVEPHPQDNRFESGAELEFRLPELENPARQHGVTLGQLVERRVKIPELQRASLVIRAQSYRRRLFEEIEKANRLLLP